MYYCIRVNTYTFIHVVTFTWKQVHTFTLILVSTCTCGRVYTYTKRKRHQKIMFWWCYRRNRTSIHKGVVDIEARIRYLDRGYDHWLVWRSKAILERCFIRTYKVVMVSKKVDDHCTVARQFCVDDGIELTCNIREAVKYSYIRIACRVSQLCILGGRCFSL